jgi:hypothetical protein
MRANSAWLVVKAGALYFALVFGAGFALGTLRVLWLVPALGERTAELLEMPVMLVIIIVAARWIEQRLAVPPAHPARLGMGMVALVLLLAAELTLVVWFRGLSIAEYAASRDPVSGSVYLAMPGLFAVMPLLVARN